MFGRFFGLRYFARRYFGKEGAAAVEQPIPRLEFAARLSTRLTFAATHRPRLTFTARL